MTEQRPLTDTDEPIGSRTPEPSEDADTEGHGILHEGLQRPPVTSRNAERGSAHSCRTPARDPHPRRGER